MLHPNTHVALGRLIMRKFRQEAQRDARLKKGMMDKPNPVAMVRSIWIQSKPPSKTRASISLLDNNTQVISAPGNTNSKALR